MIPIKTKPDYDDPGDLWVFYVLWEVRFTHYRYKTMDEGYVPIHEIRRMLYGHGRPYDAIGQRISDMRSKRNLKDEIEGPKTFKGSGNAPGYRFKGSIRVTDWPEIIDAWPNWKYTKPVNQQLELIK